MVNVENCQFLKEDCKFLSVIWVKWEQSVCSITLLYSSNFYSFFLSFFVLEIFKFKYGKVFVKHSASISKFEWFEQLWYRYRPNFYNWLLVFLEKVQTISMNQNFIIPWWYFSCCYLFVSLWHCSHMSLSYLSSDDGLIFFCFSFCGTLGLLLRLKSKKHKGSDSLPSLMGNYHKS